MNRIVMKTLFNKSKTLIWIHIFVYLFLCMSISCNNDNQPTDVSASQPASMPYNRQMLRNLLCDRKYDAALLMIDSLEKTNERKYYLSFCRAWIADMRCQDDALQLYSKAHADIREYSGVTDLLYSTMFDAYIKMETQGDSAFYAHLDSLCKEVELFIIYSKYLKEQRLNGKWNKEDIFPDGEHVNPYI